MQDIAYAINAKLIKFKIIKKYTVIKMKYLLAS